MRGLNNGTMTRAVHEFTFRFELAEQFQPVILARPYAL